MCVQGDDEIGVGIKLVSLYWEPAFNNFPLFHAPYNLVLSVDRQAWWVVESWNLFLHCSRWEEVGRQLL